MSEYLKKQAALEWLKEQQKRQEEKRDRLEIDHPYWEYHEGASDYLSLAVEEFESGAFDADNTEIQRLRAALEMAQSELRWGDPANAIERVERIIDEALSTTSEPTNAAKVKRIECPCCGCEISINAPEGGGNDA